MVTPDSPQAALDAASAPSPAGTDAETGAEPLLRGLLALARRLRRARADHGVSPSKIAFLNQLQQDGALTASDLAQRARIQPQSLTRMIAKLEDRGLISRTPDTIDRRQIRIAITAAGAALLAEDRRRQLAWLAAVMDSHLAPREQAALLAAAPLLDRLAGS